MKNNFSYCGLCLKQIDTGSGKYIVRNNLGNKIKVCQDCFARRVNEKGEVK